MDERREDGPPKNMFISKVSPVLCLIAIFFYLLCVSLSLFLRFSLSRIIANDTLRDDETDRKSVV